MIDPQDSTTPDPDLPPDSPADDLPADDSADADPLPGDEEWREAFRETLREELGAASAESRRSARRQMEVLKGIGEAVDAIGEMVTALHATTRESTVASARESARPQGADALLLPLVELADRIERAADTGGRAPEPVLAWLPGARAAAAPWKAAWERQRDAIHILRTHMAALLRRAGLEPIPTAGRPFDPAVMTAVEVVTDSARPDHSVDAVLLEGWRLAGGGRVVRSAQVRVSRST